MRIGLISDTHALMRREALDALRGSERIIHAGDIGDPAVLEALGRLAPVLAVRGNNDRGAWADELPESASTVIEGVRILVTHDVKALKRADVVGRYDVVIAGHSHRPCVDEREGVLYINPGSAGPRRFSLPITVAILKVQGGKASAALIDLSRIASLGNGQMR